MLSVATRRLCSILRVNPRGNMACPALRAVLRSTCLSLGALSALKVSLGMLVGAAAALRSAPLVIYMLSLPGVGFMTVSSGRVRAGAVGCVGGTMIGGRRIGVARLVYGCSLGMGVGIGGGLVFIVTGANSSCIGGSGNGDCRSASCASRVRSRIGSYGVASRVGANAQDTSSCAGRAGMD